MDYTCQKCKTICCPGETVVVCEGFCEDVRRFHAACVGLSNEEGDVCLYRNILWMCDDCRDLMENVHFRSSINAIKSLKKPVVSEVESIKWEIAKMSAKLNQIDETIGSLTNASSTSLNAALFSPPVDVPLLSSAEIVTASSSAELREHRNRREDTFNLYLSNIATDVTEEMICEVLCIDKIHAINCLKPTWRDTSTMDFISFKVEIDEKHRRKALSSTNWPKGI